jgi:hypothetical protein
MDESTHTSGSNGGSGTPKAKGGTTPCSPTPTAPPPQVGTPTHGHLGPIGTPTSSASTTASCYHYPPSPIDNLMGGVDMDEDNDSDEMEIDRSSATGSMKGRGGRPPLPKKKKNRKVAKPSIVCEHFTKDLNSSEYNHVAHCNYCEAPYMCHAKNYGTSNMLYYVKTCQKYRSLKANQDTSQTKFTFGSGQTQGSKNLMIAKYSEKLIRDTLYEMIIVDEMPFSTAERMGFRKLFSVLEPRLKLHSRYTMMKDCVKMFMNLKNTMKNEFLISGQRVCLTTDTWTSIQNMTYMCITGHFIDQSWKYHKKILSFHQVSDHKRPAIAREVE